MFGRQFRINNINIVLYFLLNNSAINKIKKIITIGENCIVQLMKHNSVLFCSHPIDPKNIKKLKDDNDLLLKSLISYIEYKLSCQFKKIVNNRIIIDKENFIKLSGFFTKDVITNAPITAKKL